MKKQLLFAVAFGMIAAAGGVLYGLQGRQTLGKPGVKVGPVAIYDTEQHLISRQSALLPEAIPGARSRPVPINPIEVSSLPRDTTFGRRAYVLADGFQTVASVVLMGSDRTSIHQPQFCLVGLGWEIDREEHVILRADRPFPYEFPAMKLTASMRVKDQNGHPATLRGVYVYWFVDADKITDDQGGRLFSMARSMLQKGVIERWAYVSYLAVCQPGHEDATFERMKKFISLSVPEFQLTTGRPSGNEASATANP